jgi:hypothetical protein
VGVNKKALQDFTPERLFVRLKVAQSQKQQRTAKPENGVNKAF